jgi:sugar phosphate isomerase/epimerase
MGRQDRTAHNRAVHEPPSPPQAGPSRSRDSNYDAPGPRGRRSARSVALPRPCVPCDDVPRMVDSTPLPSIQCSTGPFWAYELERAMDALACAGFHEIELMVTRDPRTQEADIPGRLAEERGLRIAAIHAPFLVLTKTVWGLNPLDKIARGTEMCRSLGCESMIVHPPYLWEREYARWLVQKAEAHTAETGVSIAVETMYPRWVAGRRVRVHRWLEPKALYRACHLVALDTSHLTVAREDILDAYHKLLPKLVHIHLSNNAGDGRDGHLEIEQGILPLDRFLDEVRRTSYSGAISLELSVRQYVERPEDLVATLRRNREFVEARVTRQPRITKGLPR